MCVPDEARQSSEDLTAVLKQSALHIVLEAGPLAQWLFEGLARTGLPAICIKTRHTKRSSRRSQTMHAGSRR
nr:hypothetical protein [Phyllobacterium endophyticum]